MIQMANQRCSATTLNSAQHLQVLKAQPGAVLFDEAITVCAN
jgi:hypothetical protein